MRKFCLCAVVSSIEVSLVLLFVSFVDKSIYPSESENLMFTTRSPLRQRTNSNDKNPDERRIYVTDLSPDCRREQIERAFDKWPIVEVWHAPASCFAFVVCQRREDVQPAIDELDGQYECLDVSFSSMF